MPGFDDLYKWGDPDNGYYAAEREAVQKKKGKLQRIADFGKPFLDGLRSNAGQVSGQGLNQNPYGTGSMSGGYDMGARPDPWGQALGAGVDLFRNRGK